jgi:glyoxylate carboligase
MTLPLYSTIRLTTNRYHDRGVYEGCLGVILEIYRDEAYEVDFADEQGNPLGWFAVAQSEVKAVQPSRKTVAISG